MAHLLTGGSVCGGARWPLKQCWQTHQLTSVSLMCFWRLRRAVLALGLALLATDCKSLCVEDNRSPVNTRSTQEAVNRSAIHNWVPTWRWRMH